ncbi:hypothetical protein ACFY2K_40455 [Kitasatospora sp. NPDC001309]|uniref:hypothetical protein n=1 Tax=Kitasatospora sp. NPDC001309 TaxID=3364013 RepID=UPI0036B16FE5
MSVVAAFHSVVPDVRRRGQGLRAAFAQVLERLAASPLDSPVLGAMGAPRSTDRPATGLHAHWHTVTRADGSTALEADWRPGR